MIVTRNSCGVFVYSLWGDTPRWSRQRPRWWWRNNSMRCVFLGSLSPPPPPPPHPLSAVSKSQREFQNRESLRIFFFCWETSRLQEDEIHVSLQKGEGCKPNFGVSCLYLRLTTSLGTHFAAFTFWLPERGEKWLGWDRKRKTTMNFLLSPIPPFSFSPLSYSKRQS